MKIAFFQNRLGRTDGVSLEVDKWRQILTERMGHEVVYCAGNPDVPGYNLPELYAQHPVTWKILRNGTVKLTDYDHETELERDIYDHADTLVAQLMRFIDQEQPDVLVPNNLCSGGYQPAAAIAFHEVFRKTGLPGIVHSHDFYFEDSGEVSATCQTVQSIYERYFPPKLPNLEHVVINRIAQRQIMERKNLRATVVPNVFDFDQPGWTRDDYNDDFRRAFDIPDDALLFLQATRILDRKGVEMAIDLLGELERPERRKQLTGAPLRTGSGFAADGKIILLCAGIVETIGISGSYWDALRDHAAERGVDLRHVGDRVGHSRGTTEGGEKIYSLWDSYVHADFVTYPSLWEGWGNQFIEAVFAKLPVVLFEYPVWQTDLGPAGFDVVSLGGVVDHRDERGLSHVSDVALRDAAAGVIDVLTQPERRREMVETNYRVGRTHFGYDALEKLIGKLLP